MALDTKQKRGSATEMAMPYRQWLAEPDGTLVNTDRMSLLKLCSAVTPAAPPGSVPGGVFSSPIFSSRVIRVVGQR